MKKKAIRFVLFSLIPVLMPVWFLGCDNGNDTGEETSIVVPVTGVQVYLWSRESESTSPYTGGGTVKLLYSQSPNGVYLEDSAGTVTGGKLILSLPPTVAEEYMEPLFNASGGHLNQNTSAPSSWTALEKKRTSLFHRSRIKVAVAVEKPMVTFPFLSGGFSST
jgi:hypothetical protein